MMRKSALFILIPMVVTACSASDVSSAGAPCAGPQTYVAGSTLSGDMAGSNCKGPVGGEGALYNMTLAQQTNIQLTLVATGFPGYLGLFTASGVAIGENNTDLKLKAFLPAGAYQVFVSSLTNQGGTFTVTSPPASLDGCSSSNAADLAYTVKGATLSGTLTATDCGNSLSKSEIYVLPLSAGAVLNVAATVDRVSGLTITADGGGAVLTRMEMSAGGTWKTSMTAATTGKYLVHIESRTVNGSSNLPVTYSILIN